MSDTITRSSILSHYAHTGRSEDLARSPYVREQFLARDEKTDAYKIWFHGETTGVKLVRTVGCSDTDRPIFAYKSKVGNLPLSVRRQTFPVDLEWSAESESYHIASMSCWVAWPHRRGYLNYDHWVPVSDWLSPEERATMTLEEADRWLEEAATRDEEAVEVKKSYARALSSVIADHDSRGELLLLGSAWVIPGSQTGAVCDVEILFHPHKQQRGGSHFKENPLCRFHGGPLERLDAAWGSCRQMETRDRGKTWVPRSSSERLGSVDGEAE